MNWTRRISAFGLVLALMAGVSCTTADGPTAVPESQQFEQPSNLLGLLDSDDGLLSEDGLVGTVEGVVGTLSEVTDLLVCSAEPYEVTTQTIGSAGGTIKVGRHTLVIPRGALEKNTTIKAEQVPGRTNSLRFSPEGLLFQKSAKLTMSYENCLVVLLPKHIVYTTESLKILEVLRSLDLFQKKTVSAPIDHFSRYAVAY